MLYMPSLSLTQLIICIILIFDTAKSEIPIQQKHQEQTITSRQAQAQVPPSGCEVCASTNNCNNAFNGSPGKFCGRFMKDGYMSSPCCCPLSFECKVSTLSCKCHYNPNSASSNYNNGQRYQPNHHSSYNSAYDTYDEAYGLGSSIFLFIFICIICCCCQACCRSTEDPSGTIPIAVPVGNSNPPPTAPSAPMFGSTDWGWGSGWGSTGRQYRSYGSNGNGSGFGSALGGFAVGTLFGEMMGGGGRRGHHHHGHRRHGHHGGGGGFDIAGDSGGGGGGFDIAGSS